MPTGALRPATCAHCDNPIVWGTLQNGRPRPFNPHPVRLHDLPATEAFAYSRRARAMVCLDAEPHPPEMALGLHYCAQYIQKRAEEMDLKNVTAIGEHLGWGAEL